MTDPIRVAMLTHVYYPSPQVGGAERQQAEIAPFLKELNVDLHIVTRSVPGSPTHEILNGVSVHRVPSVGPRSFASISYTAMGLRTLQRLKPDILHAHIMFSPARTAVYMKRLTGTPVIVTAHRSGPPGDIQRLQRRRFGEGQIKLLRNHVDTFITISSEIDREMDGIGIPKQKRTFLPNGVDAQRFAPLPADERKAMRQTLGLPADVPIVIYAGRLNPVKRVNNVLAVWPDIREQHPDALLLILGTGEDEAALRQQAGEGVRFEGLVQNVVPYLQASDIFVLPSVAEGFSVAVLEALSCELAAVITDVGGARDVIRHGENGWLIQPDNLDDIRQSFLALLGDPDRRRAIGQAGRADILKDYQLPVIATRLRAIYDAAIAARQPL